MRPPHYIYGLGIGRLVALPRKRDRPGFPVKIGDRENRGKRGLAAPVFHNPRIGKEKRFAGALENQGIFARDLVGRKGVEPARKRYLALELDEVGIVILVRDLESEVQRRPPCIFRKPERELMGSASYSDFFSSSHVSAASFAVSQSVSAWNQTEPVIVFI